MLGHVVDMLVVALGRAPLLIRDKCAKMIGAGHADFGATAHAADAGDDVNMHISCPSTRSATGTHCQLCMRDVAKKWPQLTCANGRVLCRGHRTG